MFDKDDVLVTDPPHRSVCRHCCPAHDALRAENGQLMAQRIRLFDERDRLEAECERQRAALAQIEAGYSWNRLSAAEMASIARAALGEIIPNSSD